MNSYVPQPVQSIETEISKLQSFGVMDPQKLERAVNLMISVMDTRSGRIQQTSGGGTSAIKKRIAFYNE
jgi:hypothetical protein